MWGNRICLFVACFLGGPLLALLACSQKSVPIDTSAGPHICWLDKVLTERDGVRVLFSERGPHIGSTKSQGKFRIGHNEILWLSGPKERETEPGLLLLKNESAYLIQGPEDLCQISFAEVNGHVGIIADASFGLPPGPMRERKMFIPGQ